METSEQQRRPTIGQSAQELRRKLGLDFDAIDLADMFWLAQFTELGRTARREDETQPAQSDNRIRTVEGAAVSSNEAAVNLYIDDRGETPPADQSSTEEPQPQPPPGLPFPVPAAPALRVRLDLARALRPLMRKVPSQSRYELDEDATVTQIAETQMMIPIVRLRPERWLDLDLVVEDSKTTVIWERTIAELQHLLEYQGAFRTVRTWRLAAAHPQTANPEDVQLFPRWRGLSPDYLSQRPRSPRELLDPGSRRLILVVTDCTSALWQRGLIHELLWHWAESQALSIVQLFPERLWTRTALSNGHRVQLGATAPGLPSARLDVAGLPALDDWDEFDDWDEDVAPDAQRQPDEQRCLVLPIVTLDPTAMYRWARVIAGGGDTLTPGRFFELKIVRQMAIDFATSGLAAYGAERTARQRVALFKATASKPALALAKCMAATPVSLPVIDLLRDEFVPEARQEHVAEVLLSGLLQRVDQAESNGNEQCQYEFFADPENTKARERTKTRERVRDLLVDDVPTARTRSVMDRLSQLIKDKAGNTLKSFEAFLAAFDESGAALGEGALPLATVGLEVLHRLGGSHAALAQQYERILQPQKQKQATQPTDNHFLLEDLEDLEYEVAQFINFPPLQACEYQAATITAILDRFDCETASIARLNPDSVGTSIDWNDGNKRKAFREALQEVYPSVDALAIFVDEELNENLASIAGGDNLQTIAYNLVRWANAQGRMQAQGLRPGLYDAFKEGNPRHPAIKKLESLFSIPQTYKLTKGDWDVLFEQFLPDDLADLQRAFRRGFKQALGVEFQQAQPNLPPLVELTQIQELLATYDNPELAVRFVEYVIAEFQRSSEESGRDLTGLEQWRDRIVQNNEIPPPGQDEIQEVTSAREQQYRSTQQYQGEWHWYIERARGLVWGYTELLSTEPDLDIGLAMIAIPGGSFTMGAPKSEPESQDHERPQHEVTLQPFYLGRYAITQSQWRIVAGYDRINRDLDPDPSRFMGDNRPVENVSWEHAQEFCQRLSAQTGKDYRLPSEAQWEYACRAGTTKPFHFGETITTELANYDGDATYNNGLKGEFRGETTDVGQFPANDWGLHDMHGNVLEWCEDDWPDNYADVPADGSAWVESDRTETRRLLRGGSWADSPKDCRSACRLNNTRDGRASNLGFRVCCVRQPAQAAQASATGTYSYVEHLSYVENLRLEIVKLRTKYQGFEGSVKEESSPAPVMSPHPKTPSGGVAW